MNDMYEDANSVPVPDSTAARDLHTVFHYGLSEKVLELFGDVGPFEPNVTEEIIDDDPAINAMLAANNL